jgi:hypothetical protein
LTLAVEWILKKEILFDRTDFHERLFRIRDPVSGSVRLPHSELADGICFGSLRSISRVEELSTLK